MNAPLLLIPIAIEWVILVTTLAPLVLVGRFRSTPRVGIVVWFTTFLTAGASVLIAFVVALWAYTNTVSALSRDEFGGIQWMITLAVSFAPWIALAVGGISLALVNQKLEPLVKTAKEVKPLLDLSKAPLMHFMGVPVSTVDVPFAYALATGKEILISRFAVDGLSQEEMDAVLWHELCHVREKHFALKRLSRYILALSPRLAASRALVSEIETLIEFVADNFALRHTNRQTLGQARKIFS
jgi:Zn-dependent protease with chaperone function